MTKVFSHKSERQFCKQFKATFVESLHRQCQDIDAEKTMFIKQEDGTYEEVHQTYSIKCQELAKDSKNWSFENKLIDTRTGEEALGNFPLCKAKYYALSDGNDWYFYNTQEVKDWMRENVHNYQRKNISHWRVMDNRAQGRKYDDAENIIVPIEDLNDLLIVKVKHIKRFSKDYKLQRN